MADPRSWIRFGRRDVPLPFTPAQVYAAALLFGMLLGWLSWVIGGG